MTPRELNLVAEVFASRIKMDQEERLTLAYLTAYWQRVEKLEPLDQILNKTKQNKQMTDMEMFIKAQQLNAALGGSVVE